MPLYSVTVFVKVLGESEHDAYETIQHALTHAKKQEIVYEDAEVTETVHDEEPDGEAWSGGFAPNH